MNKLLKGSIAGAVGVALLLGGAGTFANWNSSAAAGSNATISAGTLVLTPSSTAGIWKSGVTTIVPSAFTAVPGDVLTYTKTVNITATGNNLVATVGLVPGAFTAKNSAVPADVSLAGYLTKTAKIDVTGTGITGTAPAYVVTAGAAGITNLAAVVTVTITFPKSGTVGDVTEDGTKLGAVNLSDLAVTLTQN